MTASTLPPMPPDAKPFDSEWDVSRKDYDSLRSWAEACRADRDALEGKLKAVQKICDAAPSEEPSYEGWTGNADDQYDNGEERARYFMAKDIRAAIGLPDSSNSQGQEGG